MRTLSCDGCGGKLPEFPRGFAIVVTYDDNHAGLVCKEACRQRFMDNVKKLRERQHLLRLEQKQYDTAEWNGA